MDGTGERRREGLGGCLWMRCKIRASLQSLCLFYAHLLSLTRSACGFLFKPTDYKSDNGFKILVRLCLTVIV